MKYYTFSKERDQPIKDYYVVTDNDVMVHIINGWAWVVPSRMKADFAKCFDEIKEIKADDVENALDYRNIGNDMNKVKAVPKSTRYTREDLETALNSAYDDYEYIIDKIVETENYLILYFKEQEF